MIKTTFLTLLAALMFFACSQNSSKYQLSGHIDGLSDNAMVYLYSNAEKKEIDSVQSKDGGFVFTGSLDKPEYFYVLVRLGEGDVRYKGIWLENSSISLNGSIEALSSAKIEGSQIQDQEEKYNEIVKPIATQIDDLYSQYDPADAEKAAKIDLKVDSLTELENLEKIAYVKSHPDFFYSAYLSKRLVRNISPEQGEEVYNTLSDDLKKGEYGLLVREYLDLNKNLEIGDKYVELSLQDANDETLNLSSFEGKYVLIDFWASWCGPCRRESPYLTEAYEKFNDKGFEIYAISLDTDKDSWTEAIAEDNMQWATVIADGAFDSKSAMIYGVKHIPYNYLIGPNGEIIEMHLRGEALLEKLEEFLGA